jgi:hypothetical protein
MKPLREWSTLRTVLTGAGAVFLFALVINGLHRLTQPETPRLVPVPDVAENATDERIEEAGPVVTVIDDRTVRVSSGNKMHTQISIDGDPDGVQRLADCIREGIEDAAADDTTPPQSGTTVGILRGLMDDEVSHIVQGCLAEHHGLPEIPALPEMPPRSD